MKTFIFFFLLLFSFSANSFADAFITILTPSESQVFAIPSGQSDMDIYVGWTYDVQNGSFDHFVVHADGNNYVTYSTNYIVHNVSSGSKDWEVDLYWTDSNGLPQVAIDYVSFEVTNAPVNVTADNNFTASGGANHGTMVIDGTNRTIPLTGYTVSKAVGQNLTLSANSPQDDNQGYQRIWHTGATNTSDWRREGVFKSDDQIYSFAVALDDHNKTYMANLRKNYAISRNDQTEFDGTISAGVVTHIVEQNSGQISAPSTKTVNGKPYNFSYWTDNFSSTNPRTITPNDNQTYTALYKYPHHSNDANAYANNSQRKFVKDPYGYLHKVYTSMGKVWYERSTNNGATWEIQNYGKPLSTNQSKLPSIDEYGGAVVIVWQEEWYDTYKIRIAYNNQPTWNLIFNDVFDWSEIPGFDDPYSSNAMPVVCWVYDQIFVCWRIQGVGLFYKYGTGGPYWPLVWRQFDWVVDTDGSSLNPTVASKKDPFSPAFHLAWQQSTNSIEYCKFTPDAQYNITISDRKTPSVNCGYTEYYSPSILVMETDGIARLCWVGWRLVDGIENPQFKVMFRGLNNFTRHWEFGNNVVGPNINRKDNNTTNPYYAFSWYETQGQNKFADNTLSTVRTLNTVGQNVQTSNGSDKNSMYAMSYNHYSGLPYYFLMSNNLGSFYSLEKIESNTFTVGREGVVSIDSADFYFALGDIEINGQSVDFVEIADTVQINNLSILNECLVSDPISVSDNCSFVYSVQYGINDSTSASQAMVEDRFISFKVQLIDNNTGEIIGEYDNVTYNAENIYDYGNVSYQVNTQGIGNRSVRLKLIVDNNFASNYSLGKIYSDESVLGKANVQQINFSGNESITSYALSQNYPNPFNPATTIKFEIPKDGLVTLKIYDILGAEVATLVNEEKSVGRYEVNFNASSLASGVYLYRIQVNDYVDIKKMILMK